MNKIIVAVTTLFFLAHVGPVLAKADEHTSPNSAHPISGLIGDWPGFRDGILAKTKQYDKYSDVTDAQIPALPHILVGRWQTVTRGTKAGNQLQNILSLKPGHKFTYQLVALTGNTRQEWDFSGTWEVKSRLLMLLIKDSRYPGEQPHDILVWRVLHVGNQKLVYVRAVSQEMVAMTRAVSKLGS